MGRNKNASASAGVTSKEVETKKVAKAEEVIETATEEVNTLEAEVSNEVEVIPSDIFVDKDGTEVEFAVKHFIHSKRKYTVEEAVAEIPDVLQELYDRKSFIFKKV